MTLTIRLGGWWRLWIAPVLLCMLIAYNSAFAATLAERASASGCLTAPEVVEGETYRCMTATGAVFFSVPGTPPKTSPPPAEVPPASAGGDRWAALATDTANSVISVDRLSIAPAGTVGHRKGWFKTDYLAGRTVYTTQGARQVKQDKQLIYADCVGRRMATKQYISYDSNGQVLESNVLPDSVALTYADVIPDTVGESMIAILCNGAKFLPPIRDSPIRSLSYPQKRRTTSNHDAARHCEIYCGSRLP